MAQVGVEDIERLIQPFRKDELNKVEVQNLILQLIILCTDTIDDDALKFLARFFTPHDFDELVQERSVLSSCGYPNCPCQLRDSRGNVRNPLAKTVLPWQHEYCQLSCYQAAQFYREQLSREPLQTRKDVTKFRYGELSYEQNIMLLPEVTAIARMNHKSITETVSEIIKNQHLVSRLNELEIDKQAEVLEATQQSPITSLNIVERN